MEFWQLERHPGDAPALIEAEGATLSYAELAARADDSVDALPAGRKTFGFLGFDTSTTAVALYLGALRSGQHVPLLLQADLDPGLLADLAAHYRPDWIALPGDTAAPRGYALHSHLPGLDIHVALAPDHAPAPIHAELGLLLSTSGSTGSAKLVRLSASNLAANAASIVEYLGLRADDRAITTLPLSYSFGLSILNSHLGAGAAVVLTDKTLLSRPFWEQARTHGITSLSGVPATFEMLRRVGLERFQLDRLRMLTQAGGRLRDALIEEFLALGDRLGLEFFVMYGQTEAAPRISYVPPARSRDKIGSIGIAVPGGRLEIDPASAELLYHGANVMLGYAARREDLGLGDLCNGELRTGDLARRDDEGFIYLTGRAKRFVKVSGNRLNLDDAEAMLAATLGRPVACAGGDDDLGVFVAGDPAPDAARIKQLIQQRYKIFPGHVRVEHLDALPLLATGKIDYRNLDAGTPRPGTERTP